MDFDERLERLDRVVDYLAEASVNAPILVEGLRDEAALRSMGVDGEIIVYNKGQSMAFLADKLRTRSMIIVLFDWDRKGGQLTKLLREQIGAGPKVELDARKELATVSLVRCVEDLPAARRALLKRLDREAED